MTLVALILAAALAGAVIGWATNDLARQRRQQRGREWTPADDDWLDRWGIWP